MPDTLPTDRVSGLAGGIQSARVGERLVFSEGLFAVGAGGFVGAVWMEDDLPAPAVDAGFVVKLAK
jgi:hypothetical protein